MSRLCLQWSIVEIALLAEDHPYTYAIVEIDSKNDTRDDLDDPVRMAKEQEL